jgi:hypothetical protein
MTPDEDNDEVEEAQENPSWSGTREGEAGNDPESSTVMPIPRVWVAQKTTVGGGRS